jgi:ABC-2 type transport system ATP-binding protein
MSAGAQTGTTGEPVISFAGVGVSYGGRAVVEGLDLEVGRGSVFALLGRNGAGKSSLVRCALGLQRPTRGRVRLLGQDVWRRRARLLGRVGFMPEAPGAPPASTAAQLAAFCRGCYPRWDDESFARRLERFGVPPQLRFDRLSRGQQGIVMLALALAPEPELIVLDDPTLALDAFARRFVFEELVGELADHGTTVFLTSHDLAGVEGVADQVGFLANGRLSVAGTLEALKERHQASLEELYLDFCGAKEAA